MTSDLEEDTFQYQDSKHIKPEEFSENGADENEYQGLVNSGQEYYIVNQPEDNSHGMALVFGRVILLFSLFANCFNLAMYRKFVNDFSSEDFDESFTFKELQLFTWRTELALILLFAYIIIVRAVFDILLCFYQESVLDSFRYFNIHWIFNLSHSIFDLAGLSYSFTSTFISFSTILSTALIPVSLSVLTRNQDTYIMSFTQIRHQDYLRVPLLREGSYEENKIQSPSTQRLIHFFCLVLFLMGWTMILCQNFSIGFCLGISFAFSALLVHVGYQKQNTVNYIPRYSPFQIIVSVCFLSLFIVSVFSTLLQIIYTRHLSVWYNLFGWIQLDQESFRNFMVSSLVHTASIIFSLLSYTFSEAENLRFVKLLEIPLIELLSVKILHLYTFSTSYLFYFGVANILIVISMTDFNEIIHWIIINKQIEREEENEAL